MNPGPWLGELASLSAAMIWACSMSMYTRFGRSVAAAGLNLYKNIVALTCLLLTGLVLGFHWPETWRIGVFALSGLIGLALGDTLLFHGIKTVGVQRTSVIQCLAPPMAALISWLAFDETLSRWEWCGLITTTGALALLIASKKPKRVVSGGPGDNWGVLAALAASVCQALAVITLRQSIQGVDVITGTILRVLPAILVLSVVNSLRPGFESLRDVFRPNRNGLILTLAAFMGTFLGLLLMSTGAKYAKAGVTTAISSTYPVWILPIAHFILGERVSWRSAGLTLVAVLGLGIMMIGE